MLDIHFQVSPLIGNMRYDFHNFYYNQITKYREIYPALKILMLNMGKKTFLCNDSIHSYWSTEAILKEYYFYRVVRSFTVWRQ
jgi:hypothetical protein